MSKCARPDCLVIAKSSCSGCEKEQYCGSSCQKLDWKAHKSLCPILKKLSKNLQPFHEVIRINHEILSSKKGEDVRILEHLLSYLEYQFGEQVAGIDYRERGDGERISNWNVEIEILHNTYTRLAKLYSQNDSLILVRRDEMSLPHSERSLSLLNRWLIQLDLDASNRIDTHNDHQINFLLLQLVHIEQNMAAVTANRYQWDIAEGHCRRCLAYSKRYRLKGDFKTDLIFLALKTYCSIWVMQKNYSSAIPFAEEAYNLVVMAYDCVHPQVQEAAGILIDILISKGDLYDAERYGQLIYGNLRDKKNRRGQESEEVAKGAYNLAKMIYRQKGDLVKAEELARESFGIRTKIYGSDDQIVSLSCDLLADILGAQGKFGDETRGLYERSLAFSIRNDRPDGFNTAGGNYNVGCFYHKLANIQHTVISKREQLLLAKSYFVEALRIRLKILGPTHPYTANVSSCLTTVLRELSQI
jgi:hypothetical protein